METPSLYNVFDVVVLWVAMASASPGKRSELKWQGRWLLVSAAAYRPRADILQKLRALDAS